MSTTTDYVLEEAFKEALQFIEDVTSNADQVQRRVLTEILSANANVEYLQRHGLDGATDSKTFKKVVPVITYEDIKSDITRIVNGDSSPIFCAKPVDQFALSTGSTGGVLKHIPMTEEEMDRKFAYYKLGMPVLSQYMPGLEKGKSMNIMTTRFETKTPGGLVVQPISTAVIKRVIYLASPQDPYNIYTSPNETFLCPDYFQSIYSQLLCGLCQRMQVLSVGSTMAYSFVWAFKILEKHWPSLCNDIRTGALSLHVNDPSVRKAVSKILKPDPELADLVETECSKESWHGIVTKLWPNTKYVDTIATGAMTQHVPTIDYYTNGLPIVSMFYGSAECLCGINLNPLCKISEVSYTLIPTMAYFEFLPVYKNTGIANSNHQDLVDLVDVKLGQEYEPVVTTYAGLYRYKIGDVLRVTGFKNKAPQFSFVCRKNVCLTIYTESTHEDLLQNAIKNAVKLLAPFGATLSGYTSFADFGTSPGHYVLFWEVKEELGSTPVPPSVFEDCCLTIEESLLSEYYKCRVDKTIGPLEIKIVQQGTFDKLMEHAVSSGASMNQYKTPMSVKSPVIVEILNSGTVHSYFSQKLPELVNSDHQTSNANT